MLLKKGRVIKWAAVLLLLAMLLAAAGCGGSSKAVAEVNGEKITRTELDTYINILRLFMPQLEPMLSDKTGRSALDGQILDTMVDTLLIKQEARTRNIEVTAEETDALYAQSIGQMAMMFGSEEELNKKLKELKIDEKDLKEFIGSSLYSDKVMAAFAEELTDEDVVSFMEKYPDLIRVPSKLELSHILFETEEEALDAREQLLAGEDFASLAEELSIDPSAAMNRGHLGNDILPDTKDMDQDFMAAANKLVEAGEISEPVKSQFGWHLIKLHNRTEESVMSLDEARSFAAEEKFSSYFDTLNTEESVKIYL
jgi:foldase protein PrsA